MNTLKYPVRVLMFGTVLMLAATTSGVAQDRQASRLTTTAPVALDLPFPDDLTDEQEEQITAIVEKYRQAGPAASQAAALNQQLHLALLADDADEQAVNQLQQQLVAAQTASVTQMTELERAILEVFTPEQRSRLRERLTRVLSRQ